MMTAEILQMPIEDKQEFLLVGEESLNELADKLRGILDRRERDAWAAGRLASAARAKCSEPDCGIEGDNPDARFGAWVYENFSHTQGRTLLNFRRIWEVFGERQEELKRIPRSGLYLLAEPKCDPFRESALIQLMEMAAPKVRDVANTIKQCQSSLASVASSRESRASSEEKPQPNSAPASMAENSEQPSQQEPQDDFGSDTQHQTASQLGGNIEIQQSETDALHARIAELEERLAEMADLLEGATQENEAMGQVFDADDQLSAALAESKRYRELNRVLEERNRGLMEEKNAAIRAARRWQKKAERAKVAA